MIAEKGARARPAADPQAEREGGERAAARSSARERIAVAAERERLSTEVRAEIEKKYHTRYQGAVKALEGAAQELKTRQDDYLTSLGQPAFELILGLARHLLRHEFDQHPELLAGMISLGKYTFVIRLAFPTRLMLLAERDVAKNCQGSMAAKTIIG